MKRYRFDTQGFLAVDPKAFLDLFFAPMEDRANDSCDGVEIVSIRGPLASQYHYWEDSYKSILDRIDIACSSDKPTVLLLIDSPGGEVAGCFDAARAIRERCQNAGKKLVAYVEGHACSAAYALACSAEEIVASDSAMVGSIGVISTRVDVTSFDRSLGFRYHLTTSGSRKPFGNPHIVMSDAEASDEQRLVDSLATGFFELVEELRGQSVDDMRALEAGKFHGTAAVNAGLIDRVLSYDAMLAELAVGGNMDDETQARVALEKAAKSSDARVAARAKQALAALAATEATEEETPEEEATEATEEETPEEEATEEENEEEATEAECDEEMSEEATEASVTPPTLKAIVSQLDSLRREQIKDKKRAILAKRPDIDAPMRKTLMSMSLGDMSKIVAALPKPKLKPRQVVTTVAATRGTTQDSGAARLPPEDKAILDRRMGIIPMEFGVENTPHKLTLGVATPKKGA